MNVFYSNSELVNWQTDSENQKLRIGFVPTMGALHKGHLHLVEKASRENDYVICSIFVNPIQFNQVEDLNNYPRTLKEDLKLLMKIPNVGAYVPNFEDVYPNPSSKKPPEIDLGLIGEVMEAENRPGHFEGVLTVVKRLFEIIKPAKAYFGLKDYQQFLVVKKMTALYFSTIEIIPCDIIREAGGLALSSRNKRLSEQGLKEAVKINVYLKKLIGKRGNELIKAKEKLVQVIESNHAIKLEYLSINCASSLQKHEGDFNGEIRAFVAIWVEKIRLIDNIKL